MSCHVVLPLTQIVEKSAFISTSQQGGRGGSCGHRGGVRSVFNGDDMYKLKCEHCGRSRHTKDTCWDLHGRPWEL